MEGVGRHLATAALGPEAGQLRQDVGLTGRRKESDFLFRILHYRLRRLEPSTGCSRTGNDDLFDRFVGVAFLGETERGHGDKHRNRQQRN